MVLPDQSINRARDLYSADFTDAELGSDGTESTVADTTIGSAISGTNKTTTTETFFRGFKIGYESDEGDGAGNIARETTLENSSNLMLLRASFPSIELLSTTALDIDYQIILLQELQ